MQETDEYIEQRGEWYRYFNVIGILGNSIKIIVGLFLSSNIIAIYIKIYIIASPVLLWFIGIFLK